MLAYILVSPLFKELGLFGKLPRLQKYALAHYTGNGERLVTFFFLVVEFGLDFKWAWDVLRVGFRMAVPEIQEI